MRRAFRAIAISLCATVAPLYGQVLIDNFNRPNSATVGGSWTEVESATTVNAAIIGNQLLLDGLILLGREWVWRNVSGYYNSTLSANTCQLSWAFNMQQSQSDPSGFNLGNNGVAVVLAGSSSNLTVGQGYAIVLGQSGSVDGLRLVRYTNGLDANANLTTITSFGDYGNQALAVRVVYTPGANLWQVFVSSSAPPFISPLLAATPAGSAVDGTYTSIALPFMACLWNHSFGITGAFFDNIYVSDPCIPVPLPVELLGFEAVPMNDHVRLDWSTATEMHNHHFTVERSRDLQEFTTVATINGAGDSQSMIEYSVDDPAPLEGISYYRLHQVDLDGTDHVVAVVPVEWKPAIRHFQATSVADGSLTVTGPQGATQWMFFDMQGRILSSGNGTIPLHIPSSTFANVRGMGGLLLEQGAAREMRRVMTRPDGLWVEAP